MQNKNIEQLEEATIIKPKKKGWDTSLLGKFGMVFCFLTLVLTAYASRLPAEKERLLRETVEINDKQTQLHVKNEGIGGVIEIHEKNIESIKEKIKKEKEKEQANSAEWNNLQGRKYEINETLGMLERLEGVNPVSNSSPDLGK